MKIYLENEKINGYDHWKKAFIDHDKGKWVKGRSAEALARIWSTKFSDDVYDVLKKYDLTPNRSKVGYIEHKTKFDSASGPRVHDLCFPRLLSDKGEYTLCIEAKVDETFSVLNKEYEKNALKRKSRNPQSQAYERLITIYEKVAGISYNLKNSTKDQFLNLRYQLFSGLLGAIAESNKNKTNNVIFLIHVFKTPKWSLEKSIINKEDIDKFVAFISDKVKINPGELIKVDNLIKDYSSKEQLEVNYNLEHKNVYICYIESNWIKEE